MKDRERVYTFVELDGNISIQKLGILDQIRVVLKRLTDDDAKELQQNTILTSEYLKLKANLIDFINAATDPIRKGSNRKVRMRVNSKFKPVLEDVLAMEKYTEYYHIEVIHPRLPYNDIVHEIEVSMEVKMV